MCRVVPTMAILLLALGGCGGDSGPTGPDPSERNLPNGSFHATVNGEPFVPISAGVTVGEGTVTLNAFDTQARNFIWRISATGTATYSLTGVPSNFSLWTDGAGQWSATFTVGSGTITLSVFTATRAAGSFSLVLLPQGGGAFGPRNIVGTFDFDL